MPSLPEFTDRFAYERIIEVFIEMESEHSAKSDCNIGIAAEIKINIKRIKNYNIPCAEDGKIIYSAVISVIVAERFSISFSITLYLTIGPATS